MAHYNEDLKRGHYYKGTTKGHYNNMGLAASVELLLPRSSECKFNALEGHLGIPLKWIPLK